MYVLGLYTTFLASSLIGNPKAITENHPSIHARFMYLNMLIISTFSIDTGFLITDKQEQLVNILNEAGIDFNWYKKDKEE